MANHPNRSKTADAVLKRCGIAYGTKYSELTEEQRAALAAERRKADVEAPEWSTISDDGYYFNLLHRGFSS